MKIFLQNRKRYGWDVAKEGHDYIHYYYSYDHRSKAIERTKKARWEILQSIRLFPSVWARRWIKESNNSLDYALL